MDNRRQLTTILVSTLLAACGGSSDPLSATNYATRFAAARCARNLTCCAGTSGLETESQCASFTGEFWQAEMNAVIATGHVTFHADVATACIDDTTSMACGEFLAGAGVVGVDPPSCSGVLTGTQAIGAACTYGVECASAVCAGIQEDTHGNVTGPGVCVAPGGPSQACAAGPSGGTTNGSVCAAGASIDYTHGPDCVCVATVMNGSPCISPNQCSSSYCDANSGTCAAVPPGTSLPAATCQQQLGLR